MNGYKLLNVGFSKDLVDLLRKLAQAEIAGDNHEYSRIN